MEALITLLIIMVPAGIYYWHSREVERRIAKKRLSITQPTHKSVRDF
jgi:hypothetical protein